MDQHILEAKQTPNDNKAHQIAKHLQDHLDNVILDAKGDFGIFKAGIFLWTMGYVPAAAAQNLSQTPMITLPFLSGYFGPHKALRAILQAMGTPKNFYRRGHYSQLGMTQFEMRAMDYAIKTGRISRGERKRVGGGLEWWESVKGNWGDAIREGLVALHE